MIININSYSNTKKTLAEAIFKARSMRYIDLILFENSNEVIQWNNYLKNNFKTNLKEAIIKTLEFSTLILSDKGYRLDIYNTPINDKLNTESFVNLLDNGNLSIKKTYIFKNMIHYAIEGI